jgi:hypothetical protein
MLIPQGMKVCALANYVEGTWHNATSDSGTRVNCQKCRAAIKTNNAVLRCACGEVPLADHIGPYYGQPKQATDGTWDYPDRSPDAPWPLPQST